MQPRHAIALLALLVASAGCQGTQPPAPAGPAAQASTPAAPAVRLDERISKQPAPAADPWAAHPGSKDPLRRPLIWSVEKNGHTTYALGTMHMGVDPETRLPDIVWQKLEASPTFAMETDLSDPSLAKTMVERPNGGSLHRDLGDAYWKKLEGALPEYAGRMDRMSPMLPATLLSIRGLPQTPPMDGVLLGRAQGEHKQVVYLEPARKQLDILMKWMDVRTLEDLLDHLSTNEQVQKDMLAAYIAGDEAKIVAINEQEHGLWKQSGRSEAEYEQMMKEMLYDRNASWIEAIEKLHAAGGGFVAVGALHLVGKGSVLDLLQQRGYKVTRLTP
jgi:uncharacterized protein YbaP (TraB family)